MKKTVRYVIWVALCWFYLVCKPISLGAKSDSPVASVNPFIGTGGIPWASGFMFPGATIPFGMVRLSPDTAYHGVSISSMHTSGYYYGDNEIFGFSHTRLSGTGATDGGNFLVFPTLGPVSSKTRFMGQRARFSHQQETASPGYYAVSLPEFNIFAELTATHRVGVHRYTFPARREPHILIRVTNVLGDGESNEGEVRILPETQEIEGAARIFGRFSRRYGGLKGYFVARLNQPFEGFGLWHDNTYKEGQLSASGDQVGADIWFAKSQETQKIELKLGISFISIQNARENLMAEAGSGISFDDIQAQAKTAWESALSKIQIETASPDEQTIFYTALYHAFIMPTNWNDVNRDYLGFDLQVHKAEGFDYYTDISLWDTFRTAHPLFMLILPERQRDIVISMIKMAEQGGWLPRWPSGAGYTNSMLGTPADIMISETYLKGIQNFDVEAAYQAMMKTAYASTPQNAAFSGREGWDECQAHQYCPADVMEEAVSRTLEFAHADDGISRLAQALGKTEDAAFFKERAQWYRNVWNPKTYYFQPRNADGTFFEPFFPKLLTYLDPQGKYTNDYVEGSPLQWRWYVPFDAEGLISLFQSREHFVSELNTFFAKSPAKGGAPYPSPYYWHGNQPDIHAAYLFNAAKRPDLTQKWVRWILDNKYGTGPDGLDGNDDAGTLSAWYIFSALGFYPIAGSDRYEIGVPRFARAEMALQNGAMLTIIAQPYAPENRYIQNVWLNDVALDRTWFTHEEISGGATLRFEMGPLPSTWGQN